MLVDMEIPGWDERFLSAYDPTTMADLYARAGASAAMFSCKALTGLCFWPAEVGEIHPGVAGRDVIGDTVSALAERDIAACAYYSVIYDNWAFENHPEWKVEFAGGWRAYGSPGDRHGLCCPNNPGYRDYVAAQIADLYGRFAFQCAFCDMSFWPGICVCDHCRERYGSENGAEIPAAVNWTGTEWCSFAAARDRWIDEFQGHVTNAIKAARPGIAVYHNFAIGPVHWLHGVPCSVTQHSDFLGGDLYGDELEQQVVIKLMNNLSRSRPVEYMTFVTVGTDAHVRLKTPERMRTQVLAAATEGAAFMFIDAIDPIGTANPGDYDRVRAAFDEMARYEPHLAGTPIEDVAVYFSDESKVDFGENGVTLQEMAGRGRGYPHLDAVRGACRALQRARIPFGVITRRQLGELARYPVLVLPNVARMDDFEVDAIREYVRAGGRLYASKYTSLVHTRGVRNEDFMLADLFGIHLTGEEGSIEAFAKPAPRMVDLFAPQRYVSFRNSGGSLGGGLLRIVADPGTDVLATLSLPFGHPDTGDINDHRWSSIHSFPPWEESESPVLVERRTGAGTALYCTFDLERDDADADQRVFTGLIRGLLADKWSVGCDGHQRVWLSAFEQPNDGGIRVALLNPPPAADIDLTLRVRAREGRRFVAVDDLSSGGDRPFTVDGTGDLECRIDRPDELTIVLVRTE
jgi:hypothetical protein